MTICSEKPNETWDRVGMPRLRLWSECAEFLNHEAELLDHNRLDDWLGLLTPDVEYCVPIRITRERAALGREYEGTGFHMRETHESLTMRVKRLATTHAWAEDPPSRTMRLITNVRVAEAHDNDLAVRSNMLVYRSWGDGTDYTLTCGERRDVLRRVGLELKLAKREVLLTHTTLPGPNLAILM